MTREEHLLNGLDRNGFGLEIGPSHSPVAPKRSGFKVTIIDINNQDDLRKKYADHGVALDNIEEVDFVWKGESYSELTGKREHFDWVIASHVIEHVPDMIAFLLGCEEVLNRTGVLSLAIPDKRNCFDYFRPISGLGKVIDAHYSGQKHHTAGTIAEYLLNATRVKGQITWEGKSEGPFDIIVPVLETIDHFKTAQTSPSPIDAHAWCFTTSSFRLLIHDLNLLGLISLKEVSYTETIGHEFFMQLSRAGAGVKESRMDLLEALRGDSQ